jgi:ATP-binding cassette subfamily C (CFTR/MRP) protein 1
MAAVLAGAAFVMTILQRFYLRSGRELRRLDLTSKSPIFTLFSETIDPDGLRTIRAMKAQETCLALMTAHTTASQHPAWLIMVVRKWLELALTLCVTAINTLLVLVAVINRHSTSAGILAAAMASAASMTGAIVWLVVEWTNVEVGITSVERVQEYIELPPQQDCSVSSSALDPEWLKSGALSFQHLSVRYRPELPLALDDVSFEVKPGQRVGICGRTGSGKSTLLGVMWRLIDHEDDSRILVGGRDIRTVPLPAYRSAVSIIPQDPLLLELSLRDNLDPEGLHTDADLWNALERAQLKPHIETLSCKLDEMMAGDGGSFSRGQRQLLALARAILRNRPVLALDEATSSIDVKTDAAIQRTIRESFEGATVLTIAHRISTIIDYDLIVVMDAGRLVEIGSPQVLLGKRDGHFKRLALENGAISESSGSDVSTNPCVISTFELTASTALPRESERYRHRATCVGWMLLCILEAVL